MSFLFFLFFFNDTATTEIYTLSLHDALPISPAGPSFSPNTSRWPSSTPAIFCCRSCSVCTVRMASRSCATRSEEHTSELQSRRDLVCRLLLEKKKNKQI